MSEIEHVHQQINEMPDIVNRDEFTIELKNYYNGHNENSKKLEWSNKRIQSVIKLLDEYIIMKSVGKRLTNKHYHHAKKYDVMIIDNRKVLIVKRKDISDPAVQILPTEEYYDKILHAHIATGHGRRDKVVYALKDKYMVPIFAVSIFLNMCKICLLKKKNKKETVFKPLNSINYLNRRGQIDIVDFQTYPDQEYKWLLQYQDHLTKFCFLRPLKSNKAKEVAIEILKIFLEVGCPHILQSDSGREFTACVLKEISSLWPACKIVNGIPRHSQSQSSIEYQDVKHMIQVWMTENESSNWSIGCYFVQFQKNTSYDSTVAQTPYKALFGEDPNLGLSSSYISKNIISKLKNEEDVEKLFEGINSKKEQNSEHDEDKEEQENESTIHITKIETLKIKQEEEERTTSSYEDIISEQSNIIKNPELVSTLHENLDDIDKEIITPNTMSYVGDNGVKIEQRYYLMCKKESYESHICTKCKKTVHFDNECCGSQLLCKSCENKQNVVKERTQSHVNLKRPADEIASSTSKKHKDVSTGSNILVEVPKVEIYKGAAFGVIKDWIPRLTFLSPPNVDIAKVKLPLTHIASPSSFGGQGVKHCNCKNIKNGLCVSKKCNCKKANVLCNPKCHSSLTCNNK